MAQGQSTCLVCAQGKPWGHLLNKKGRHEVKKAGVGRLFGQDANRPEQGIDLRS